MPTNCHLKTKSTLQLYNFMIIESNYKSSTYSKGHHGINAQGHGREAALPWKIKASVTEVFSPTFLGERAYSSCSEWASHCGGFSGFGAQTGHLGSVVAVPRLRMLHGMWDLPGTVD